MKGRQQDLHMKWEEKKKNTGAKQQGDKFGEDISTVWEEERKQTKEQKYPKVPYLGTRDKQGHRRQKGRGRDRRSQGVIRKS